VAQVADEPTPGTAGREWLVTGHKGPLTLRAEGATEAEAWRRAVEQAEAHGDPGRNGPRP
jgi:hypothetical protein